MGTKKHNFFYLKWKASIVGLVCLSLCLLAIAPVAVAEDMWVGTWATGHQITEPHNLPPAPGLTNNTIRQEIRTSIGGDRLRFEFSNVYGNSPVTIQAAHLAESKGGGVIDPATDKVLTFDGKDSVTIPAGEAVNSDTIDFEIKPLTRYAITTYFGETSPQVSGHPGSRTTSYINEGNTVTVENMSSGVKTDHWYIIASLDLWLDDSYSAISVLGDSITDGRGSTTNGHNRWPDVLAECLQADPETAKIGVLNMGIGGNAVVRGGLGPAASQRFDHDCLEQDGVRWIVVLEGVNDIGGQRFGVMQIADSVIAEYKKMVEKAREKNIKIYGATILPFVTSFYDVGQCEEARVKINEWIREEGNFDAVIDLDAVVKDPDNPKVLLPAYDDSDHLHLSPAGLRAMGEGIDLNLFK